MPTLAVGMWLSPRIPHAHGKRGHGTPRSGGRRGCPALHVPPPSGSSGVFTSASRSGSNGRWKAKKNLLQPRPHRGVVVMRLGEVELRALQCESVPTPRQPFAAPIQGRLVPADSSQEEQDGRVGSRLAHAAIVRADGESGKAERDCPLPTDNRQCPGRRVGPSREAAMGLDAVELVLTVEDTFGFSIPDEDAEGMSTMGKLYDYVLAHRFHGKQDACLSSMTFYKVRRALMSVLKIERNEVRVSTELSAIIPERRRRTWQTLRRLPPFACPCFAVRFGP